MDNLEALYAALSTDIDLARQEGKITERQADKYELLTRDENFDLVDEGSMNLIRAILEIDTKPAS